MAAAFEQAGGYILMVFKRIAAVVIWLLVTLTSAFGFLASGPKIAPSDFFSETLVCAGENEPGTRNLTWENGWLHYDTASGCLVAAKTVNGNSNASTKHQHGYLIKDTHNDGAVVKNGISGQPLNQNGTSPRANAQANKWNKEPGNEGRYETEVVFEVKEGPGARQAAKEAEVKVSDQNRATLDPERHQRP